MISVLIVEDEIAIARGLSLMITQKYPDFQVVEIARNGKDGLQKSLALKPNLIFTDINMPTMNGLEMIAQIQQAGLSPRYVILSGYAEFEYARSAMQMGITDYLLKPITPDTLDTIIQATRQYWKTEIRILQTEYLQRQLGKAPSEPIPDNPLRGYRCTLFLLLSGPICRDIYNEVLYDFSPAIIEPHMLNLLESEYQISLIPLHGMHHNEYVCALITSTDQPDLSHEIAEKLYQLLKNGKTYINLFISGNIQHGENIPDISKELYVFALFGTPFGHGGIHTCTTLPDQKISVSQDIKQICSGIPELPARETLYDFLHTMRLFWEKEQVTQFQLTTDLIYFISTVMQDYSDDYIFYPDVTELVTSSHSFQDLERGLQYELDQIYHFNDPTLTNSQLSLAKQVRNWLDRNFTTPISYQVLKDVFGHNEKYISALFKAEYGISPSKYIGELRLNMAKKLMQSNPNILLKDVAEMVGFTDVFYFSRTFKSHEGISPSQYAQNQKDMQQNSVHV